MSLENSSSTGWHPAKIYTAVNVLRALGMASHATIYSLFLRQIGISQDRISLLNAFFWLVLILSELPTGMLADGRSRAWSVKAGSISLGLGVASYSLAWNFWSALASEVVIGVAFAFLSGAEQAWLTDALAARGEGESLKNVYAKTTVWSAICFVIGGVIGDFIGTRVGFRASWLVGGIFILLGSLLAVRLMNTQGEPSHRLTEMQALKQSVKALKYSPGLLWAVLAAMSLGFVNPFNHFWNQFFEPRLQGYSLSWIWIPLYGSCALTGILVRKLKFSKGHEAGAMLGMLGLSGFGLTVMGHLPGIGMPLAITILHEVGRGAYVPLADVYVQRRVESGYRATYGSLHSFLGRMGNVVVLAGVWFFSRGLADSEFKIVSIWTVCGSLLVLTSLILFFFKPEESSESVLVQTAQN
ncbi:MAG: MFS transporter [Patescibacteria group bacterium]|nr:MFS transporter [Patescibacteria group bacterium]